jgi:ribosomal protein S18 acetylase RimI-like enzyme
MSALAGPTASYARRPVSKLSALRKPVELGLVIELEIRAGGTADEPAVLGLFDEAVEWLVQRGLSGQWGEQPFSARPEMRELVDRTLRSNEVRVAEHAAAVAGVLAVGACPPYVPGNPVPELYVALLLSSRRLRGNEVGARLLDLACGLARERGRRMIRVDCWADSPRLISFYERQGFTRAGRFDLRGWRGQILAKQL